MEDLRIAAIAYFNNAPSDIQQLARDFFNSMDKDGDGRVSFNEFTSFLSQSDSRYGNPDRVVPANFFATLDSNGDRSLDFEEVLTLYYIMITRTIWCDHCKQNLLGLYFTCVECFDTASYDLCASCYGKQEFSHGHDFFLDSYVLLRSKNGLTRNGNQESKAERTFTRVANALGFAMNVGHAGHVAFGSAAASGCSIM